MGKHKPLPPLPLLNELFEIDWTAPSGLRWKIRKPGVKIGANAGTQCKRGYWKVGIKTDKTRVYAVHRIIYFMQNGIDPGEDVIDHYGEDRLDNSKIRLTTQALNSAHSRKQKSYKNQNPSSKYKGVTWFKRNKKWGAQIRAKEKVEFLGLFDCEQEAALAYNKAAEKAWKEFAVLNILTEEDFAVIEKSKKQKELNFNQSSTFIGVCWHKATQKWAAKIGINGKRVHLGIFSDEIEAAKAYNSAAIQYRGLNARLNKITLD